MQPARSLSNTPAPQSGNLGENSIISVLYVDDEAVLLDLTRLFLEDTQKFAVTTAGSASSALALMKQQNFDAIISDYQMPGMDGIEFLRKIRADHGEIPFILFTGKGREEVAIEAINNGADSYIQKGGAVKAQFAELAHRIRVVVERYRARAMLRGNEQGVRYRTLFESAGNAILIARVEGDTICVDDANNRAVSLFRMDKSGLLAAGPFTLVPEFQPDGRASADIIRENIRRALQGETVIAEWVYLRGDRTGFPGETTLARADSCGKSFVQAIVRDTTAQKQTIDALSLANRKISLLAAITRHDIRNRLMVLEAYLSLMDTNPASPMLQAYIKKALDALRGISRQIEFAKEYQDLGKSEPMWQDISELVQSVASRIDPEGIRIEAGIGRGIEVYADRMLENVIFNLIQNAIFHGKHARTVSFSLQQGLEGFTVIVQDDGAGIDSENKERIFERGFGRNSGLGLFLIREILGITGIAIRETGRQGEGARFEIFIPEPACRIVARNP